MDAKQFSIIADAHQRAQERKALRDVQAIEPVESVEPEVLAVAPAKRKRERDPEQFTIDLERAQRLLSLRAQRSQPKTITPSVVPMCARCTNTPRKVCKTGTVMAYCDHCQRVVTAEQRARKKELLAKINASRPVPLCAVCHKRDVQFKNDVPQKMCAKCRQYHNEYQQDWNGLHRSGLA